MNIITRTLCACLLVITAAQAQAKDYMAVAFGAKSDGTTLNTRSIQQAIDYISEHGGGRLIFYVGRYLTGSVELKSNVTLVIQEGAVLLASPSIYDQKGQPRHALIYAKGQHDIAITGRGIIAGNSAALLASLSDQVQRGYLPSTTQVLAPTLVSLTNCRKVQISDITLQDAAYTPMVFSRCDAVVITGTTLMPSAHASQAIESHDCEDLKSNQLLTYPY